MPDYKEGKIYAIRSHLTDDIYIGSTCQPLHKRLYHHKITKNTSSKEIIDLGDAYIELIENYPCNDRNELNKREGHHIRSNNCVNKLVAGRTYKEWYNDNKEQKKEKVKEYNNNNKEYCLKKIGEWQEDNKEKVKEYKRKWYLRKKELKNQTI